MSSIICSHHMGVIVWGSDGQQHVLGGQNAAVLASANSINPSGVVISGRSNAGLGHNRTMPSIATISDPTSADSQATIQRLNPSTANLFNSGVLSVID